MTKPTITYRELQEMLVESMKNKQQRVGQMLVNKFNLNYVPDLYYAEDNEVWSVLLNYVNVEY